MEHLSAVGALVVSQKKEWGEIVTGGIFETRNRYTVSDGSGNKLYVAAEEPSSTMLRLFLQARRPFTIAVLNNDGQTVIRVTRPFRFYFHRAEVADRQGRSLGVIERRFSIMRRIYAVSDMSGHEVFQLFGPILRPWTFEIRNAGVEYGKIIKKWSGLLKEGFTNADNFGVTFAAEWGVEVKALVLGAVFLIDFVHFENK